jgi:hypothetical protein
LAAVPLDGDGPSSPRWNTFIEEKTMARRKPKAQAEFILFDVQYVDGTRTSNRKVPSSALGGLEGDAPAQAIIESQDLEIAKRSGQARPAIKLIARTPVKTVEK